ncbi:unnamed protein product [Rhizophagus irregularis]|nr:unnamed protein product [Rhizophagus irregularis]
MGECRRCHNDKKIPKKFSADNNMDPGEVPDELQGLTDIEEMLIAQVFTVMSVYQLRGGQNDYKGNVINFPQDVREFTRRLPRNPSSLDVLIHQIRSDQIIDEIDDILNENENGQGDAITRSFVPAIPSTQRENAIINDTLDRI